MQYSQKVRDFFILLQWQKPHIKPIRGFVFPDSVLQVKNKQKKTWQLFHNFKVALRALALFGDTRG